MIHLQYPRWVWLNNSDTTYLFNIRAKVCLGIISFELYLAGWLHISVWRAWIKAIAEWAKDIHPRIWGSLVEVVCRPVILGFLVIIEDAGFLPTKGHTFKY